VHAEIINAFHSRKEHKNTLSQTLFFCHNSCMKKPIIVGTLFGEQLPSTYLLRGHIFHAGFQMPARRCQRTLQTQWIRWKWAAGSAVNDASTSYWKMMAKDTGCSVVDVLPLYEATSSQQRSQKAHIVKDLTIYLPPIHLSENGMNHALCLPSQSWSSFYRLRRDGRLSRPSWLVTRAVCRDGQPFQ